MDHVVQLLRNGSFRSAYSCHEMVSADGWPVALAYRFAGFRVSVAAGSDLLLPILALAESSASKVAFVGSSTNNLSVARDRLLAKFPNLDICYLHSPSFPFNPTGPEANGILNEMIAKDVKLCILALGAPKQEVFAASAAALGTKIGFCSFGAALDFVAGSQVRAPRWLRLARLEWAWRWCRQPRRMSKRYFQSAIMIPKLLGYAFRHRFAMLRFSEPGIP